MVTDIALACLVGSAVSAVASLVVLGKLSEAIKGLRSVYRRTNELEETLNELRELSLNEGLSKKAVLSLIEAARLLAEDARNMYEWTGEEKFLNVARKWEAFVEFNRSAVEKALGYDYVNALEAGKEDALTA